MRRFDPGLVRWRILAATLAVAAAGATAVALGVWIAAPRAFESAMGRMSDGDPSGGMMGGRGSGGMGSMMDPAVQAAYSESIGTALLLGVAVAVLVAVVVAWVVAARIARPIDELSSASHAMASGDLAQRVPVGSGELGDLARSFNEMAAALAATEERRRALIGDVAHELRTPIASLRGYVEGLEAGVIEPGSEAWGILDEQTTRLATLVDDLALLWRADTRDLRLTPDSLDAPSVVHATIERHRPAAETRRITLRSGRVEAVTVIADRQRLGQVLDNLVGNALRYTPAGGSVSVGCRAEGHAVVVEVADDGLGLAPGEAERVFERFYRADGSRSRDGGGSGLGLAISRSLVEAMGGTIRVTSEGLGMGSTFAAAVRFSRLSWTRGPSLTGPAPTAASSRSITEEDLMDASQRAEFTRLLTRLVNLGRACGISVIAATQRPSSGGAGGAVVAPRIRSAMARITLFLNQASDYAIALDRPARRLLPRLPGRAALIDATGELVILQALDISDADITDVVTRVVRHREVGGAPESRPSDAEPRKPTAREVQEMDARTTLRLIFRWADSHPEPILVSVRSLMDRVRSEGFVAGRTERYTAALASLEGCGILEPAWPGVPTSPRRIVPDLGWEEAVERLRHAGADASSRA